MTHRLNPHPLAGMYLSMVRVPVKSVNITRHTCHNNTKHRPR